jgi:5'-3' exonuclease
MGIRGVWTAFRQLFKIIKPEELDNLKIGIDMFSLVYTHRSVLDELLELLKAWSIKGHTIVCVWDGTAPKEKNEIIQERRSIRESAVEKKEGLETYLAEFGEHLTDADVTQLKTAITSLGWQGWHLTGKMKREIQEKLGTAIQHVFADGEADDLLLEMAFNSGVDVVLSLDSDLFVMGAPRIWRLMNIRKKWVVEDISVEAVCNDWGMSLSKLQDASFLAGWDRCHMKGGEFMRFETALTRVKHYGTWHAVLEKYPVWNRAEKQQEEESLIKLKRESKERWRQLLKPLSK